MQGNNIGIKPQKVYQNGVMSNFKEININNISKAKLCSAIYKKSNIIFQGESGSNSEKEKSSIIACSSLTAKKIGIENEYYMIKSLIMLLIIKLQLNFLILVTFAQLKY